MLCFRCVGLSGVVTHHTTAGAISALVTWRPEGLEMLSGDILTGLFSPRPQALMFALHLSRPSPVLTTNSSQPRYLR